MTWFEVEPPFQERARWFEQRFDRELAASVWMEVAQEAPEDDEGFHAQRAVAPEASAGELVVVSVDGTGLPMMQAEAVTLKATLGPGEKRQRKQEALVGVCYTVDAKPRLRQRRSRHSWSIRKPHAHASSGPARRTRGPEPNRCVVWPAWCGRSRR
jgi:hypothetical protein